MYKPNLGLYLVKKKFLLKSFPIFHVNTIFIMAEWPCGLLMYWQLFNF